MFRRAWIESLQLAVRASVGAAASFALAEQLELEHPVFAFVAAVIVTDLSPARTRSLAGRRLLATLLGAALGAGLARFWPPEAWSVAAGVLIAMLATSALQAQEAARVAGYICGVVMLAESEALDYALDRTVETLLGVAVAWAISHVPKLIRLEEPEPPRG